MELNAELAPLPGGQISVLASAMGKAPGFGSVGSTAAEIPV
jgi:hypothetical protein